MSERTCFVVMGFGKRMDYRNSKTVDLDIVYNMVIKSLFEDEFKNYKLIRADEIKKSGIIDKDMYELLLTAELVIADITTLNENAIYELGIRHALKPFSTIIMMQKNEKFDIPFDLNHCRILTYNDYGEKLCQEEADKIKKDLAEYVRNSETDDVDSPFYHALNIDPQNINIIGKASSRLNTLMKNQDSISDLLGRARELMVLSKFYEACEFWEKLHDLLPNNEYVVQQWALAMYKSKEPNVTKALEAGLDIIKKLEPDKSLDIESLGITGAIYKRLSEINNNYDYLTEAIKFYKKGYMIQGDYYNGENYAVCLIMKSKSESISDDEKAYLKFESKTVFEDVVEILEKKVKIKEIDYWGYASLAVSYYCLGNVEKYNEYEKLFLENKLAEWEEITYRETLNRIE